MTKKTKNALVLGGGGSRGSYTIGVLITLMEQDQKFDLVSGISIGAIVGAIFAMDKPVDLKKVISSFTSDSVATGLFSFPDCHSAQNAKPDTTDAYIEAFQKDGPSVDPLREGFRALFDYEAFKKSPIDYACLAANISQNKEAIFRKSDLHSADDVEQAVLASAAYFPAFSFVKIGDDYFADGGFLNEQLGRAALDLGATDLTIVSLAEPDGDLSYCQEQTRLLFRPILRLADFLDFSPDRLKLQIIQGRLEALKVMNLAPGYIYTFYREDEFLFSSLSKITVSVLEKNGIHLSDEMLIAGISALLGYHPGPLNNRYMMHYQAGLLLECLALIAGINMYELHHLIPFVREILHHLETFQVHPTAQMMSDSSDVDRLGAVTLMVFFHGALARSDGKLPDEYYIIRKKFEPVYYLSLAWYILDKFSILFKIF